MARGKLLRVRRVLACAAFVGSLLLVSAESSSAENGRARPKTSIATLIFEGGGFDVSDASYSAVCAPGCPARDAQKPSPDASFMGVAIQFNLLAMLGMLERQPVYFSDSFYLAGPFFGFRVRHYFNYRGEEVGFDFHPTPGLDTFLAYNVLFSYKTYLGMQFMWMNPLGAAEFALGIAPYVGINFERGNVRLRADETGGGGTVNTHQHGLTRSGTAVGVDLDFYFRNLPFFIGLGLQWDYMPEVPITGTSAITGIAYNASVAARTDFSAAARIGIPLGGNDAVLSDIRLKRDIALVGQRPDGVRLYRYRYLWSDVEYVGVMAQEVAHVTPHAVVRGDDGFLRVHYERLGTRLMTLEEYQNQPPG
jgi:hypothetical protein